MSVVKGIEAITALTRAVAVAVELISQTEATLSSSDLAEVRAALARLQAENDALTQRLLGKLAAASNR